MSTAPAPVTTTVTATTTLHSLSPRSRAVALVSMLRRLATSGIKVSALPSPVTLTDGRVRHCNVAVHKTSTLSARDRSVIVAHGQEIAALLQGNPPLVSAIATYVSDYEAKLRGDQERERLERRTPPVRREPGPNERARRFLGKDLRDYALHDDPDGLEGFLSYYPNAYPRFVERAAEEVREFHTKHVTLLEDEDEDAHGHGDRNQRDQDGPALDQRDRARNYRPILMAREGFARFIADQDRRADGTDNCLGVILDRH